MALINCPECGREISDKAKSCPSCGYSVDAQVIEATGKGPKITMILSFLLIVAGVFVEIFGVAAENKVQTMYGALAIIFGLALFIGARVSAWWHHG